MSNYTPKKKKWCVLKPNALAAGYRTMEHRLIFVTSGFGTVEGARGTAVFGVGIDGRHVRWERPQFVRTATSDDFAAVEEFSAVIQDITAGQPAKKAREKKQDEAMDRSVEILKDLGISFPKTRVPREEIFNFLRLVELAKRGAE